jgi:hypothetical protein
VRFACESSVGSRASAAGVTWTLLIASAPWARRYRHTSVVDAAGAIFVIGGLGDGFTYCRDVWASTDGGARPDSRGYSRGTLGGTRWNLRALQVLQALQGVSIYSEGYCYAEY